MSCTEIVLISHYSSYHTSDADGLLSQALLTGNFEAAVEICMCENKMAEAIILAIAGGPDLLSRTQKRFFQKSKCSIGRVSHFCNHSKCM